MAWARAVPSNLSLPSAANLALTAASVSDVPYFSSGSYSPRSAAPMASMASDVVPPNMEDRSAPRPMSWLVLVPNCSMGMPAFLSEAPSWVAKVLYSELARPTV